MSTEKVAKDLAKQFRNVGPKLAAKLVEARIDSPEKPCYKPAGDIQFGFIKFLNKWLEGRYPEDFPKSDPCYFYNMFFYDGLHADKIEKRCK